MLVQGHLIPTLVQTQTGSLSSTATTNQKSDIPLNLSDFH